MVDIDVKQYSNLNATRIRVCFIYTFLFTSIDIQRLFPNYKFETELLDQLNKGDNKYQRAFIHWAGGESRTEECIETEREISYLDPFVHLKVPHIHLTPNIGDIKLEYGSDKKSEIPNEIHKAKTSISCQVIVLDSGWGRLFYELDVCPNEASYFSKETIVEISNLGLRKKPYSIEDKSNDRLCRVKIIDKQSNEEKFLFDMFFNTIKTVEDDLNCIIPNSLSKISWIEVKEDLVGRATSLSNKTGEPLTHFQNPYPIIILEVTKKQYAMNFFDDEQRKQSLGDDTNLTNIREEKLNECKTMYTKELMSVLARSKEYNFPDITFAKRFVGIIDGRLLNMCSTCSIFFHLYTRSCLVISPGLDIKEENKIESDPASYLIPCLISTVSSLRCRWHAYATLGKWLDKLIMLLDSKGTNLEKAINEIIKIRTGAARSLVDPITYRAGSGSLSKLYEVGVSIFRIEELQRIIVEKFSTIDGLYGNLYERLHIEQLKMIKMGKTRTNDE